MEVAGGVDAGPGDAFVVGDLVWVFPDGEVDGAEEGVFGALHEAEEVGEVDDAGHVGVRELDAVGVDEAMFSHGEGGRGACGLMS